MKASKQVLLGSAIAGILSLALLNMRLYWPKTEAPSVLPAGTGTWSPPGVVQVN